MTPTCTRRLELDAAHRVTRHESKCAHLHGHRYVIEVTCSAQALDGCGRVIDFGVVKTVLGGWLDEHWDHGTLVCIDDVDLLDLCARRAWKHYVFDGEPTAENIAAETGRVAQDLLAPLGVKVVGIRVYETPGCWSDWTP